MSTTPNTTATDAPLSGGVTLSSLVRDAVALPLRLILGGLFVFAGVIKLLDPQQFAFSVAAFRIFPPGVGDHLTIVSTFAFPWAEVILGVLLILGLWTRASALLTTLLLAGFIGAILSVIARGLAVECGCFGKIDFICGAKVGACTVARNSVMLAMAIAILAMGGGRVALDFFRLKR